MNPSTEQALVTLRRMARGHPGASSGERAAWDILKNFEEGTPVDFASSLIRLDSEGRHAVATIIINLAVGKTGLIELR